MAGATMTVLAHPSRLRAAQAVIRRDPEIARRAELHPVDTVGQAVALLRTRLPGVVVAAGGDGTVNMVVTALWRLESRSSLLGVLPIGTGNALAHGLGVGSFAAALRTLRTGLQRTLDVMVTDRQEPEIAVLSVSTGFESRFLAAWNRDRTLGRTRALLGAGSRSLRGPRARVSITLDGRPLDLPPAVWNAGLYNLTHYGFGRRVFPEADPGDGEVEAVVWASPGAYWRSLALGAGPDAPGVLQCRWRHALFVSDQPFQVDGEPWPAGSLEVRLEPGWLRCLGAEPMPGGIGLRGQNRPRRLTRR